ncbi:fumarylacetoacetate hydrolase [Tardiphaga sp. OK246]|uniref:fumarylacetoacetase n=1 Tax=Tardiphaga sp. OK246 TaxID=1855307 RepID=UPI000B627D27|nr:fumarylacetoacetase [Tardiphaga sp. OK246]SNT32176.1 fumarylacetoacetate hydrolase [Tardiphaga sp. OK246]
MHPNDPSLRSFIDVSPTSDFPIQNLPYGVFSTETSPSRRVCVAIGDFVLDLHALKVAGLIGPADVFSEPTINAFMALGPDVWSATRARISKLLRHDNPVLRDDESLRARALFARSEAKLHLPIRVSGFTDFYSSREHATNVGMMFRDKENALSPNWLHIPIGYNGRASTVVVSGTKIRRPRGQMKRPSDSAPSHGPCQRLDFELEIGTVIGQPSAMGTTLSEKQAEAMIFGFVLLNDWSARDIQQWEYVPLGPFQAKAFATSLGPWVVSREALEPFRVHGPTQSPEPLPYLHQTVANNYDLALDVTLLGSGMKDPVDICSTNFKYMYWSPIQQLVHHASSGCAMEIGDLLGSGTISGHGPNERGSFLELSWNGTAPIKLTPWVKRSFLNDGDSLSIRGHCSGEGYKIGFGEVEGTILPSI